MESHPHRTNSDFQLRYFLAGGCHTPDGAWMLMYGQRIAIDANLKNAEAQRLRRDAKIEEARFALSQDIPPWQRMLAEANIIEAKGELEIWNNNVKAARNELATIDKIMAELEPHRKYKNLPTLEANEAAQRDEWLGELKERAENFLVTQGTIPHDHFHHMRCHPDFATELLPHIRAITKAVKSSTDDALSLITPKALTHGSPAYSGNSAHNLDA
jgi:hypothetical protein